mgnify:CR=1 FL=1
MTTRSDADIDNLIAAAEGMARCAKAFQSLVERLEWIQGNPKNPPHCEICHAFQPDGHMRGCVLGKAISRPEAFDR